jgi:hypothetical protein
MSDAVKKACRCGWDGVGDHPCHYPRLGPSYSCKRPAKERFYYDGHPFSLAGVQMKLSVNQTFACDECWEVFSKELKEHLANLEKQRENASKG